MSSGEPVERATSADHRQGEVWIDELPVRRDQGEEQQAEADEDEPVRRPDRRST